MRKILNFVAVSVCLASASAATDAFAASITQPGETVGLATGAQLPEGVFFIDGPNWGSHRGIRDKAQLGVNTPVLIWQTPLEIFGAKIGLIASTPAVFARDHKYNVDVANMYNPYFSYVAAWDLGGGWGFSNSQGIYTPIDNALNQEFWVYNNRNSISYTANGWNLTAYTVVGLTGDDKKLNRKTAPDYFNYDLTAVKSFGKWQLGAVGFGSFDMSHTDAPGYRKQAQFAVGPFLGYDFGSFTAQVWATRDIATKNYVSPTGSKNYESRIWTRLILPIWVAPQPAVPLVTKY